MIVTLSIVSLIICLSVAFFVIQDWRRRERWEEDTESLVLSGQRQWEDILKEIDGVRGDIGNLRDALSEVAHSAADAARKKSKTGMGVQTMRESEHNIIRTLVEELAAISPNKKPLPDIAAALDPPANDPRRSTIKRTGQNTPTPRPRNVVSIKPDIKSTENEHEAEDKLSDEVVKALIQNATDSEKVAIFMQPIVTLPQRKPVFLEVYARLRAGKGLHVSARRYARLARSKKAWAALDNILLFQAIRILKAARVRRADLVFFCNITVNSLRSNDFMTNLTQWLANDKALSKQLVFEMKQSEIDELEEHDMKVMTILSQLGCKFSMDHVNRLDIHPAKLKALNVKYVKIPATVLEDLRGQDVKRDHVRQLLAHFKTFDIQLIADKVETLDAVPEILDYHMDYGQGYAFARPDIHVAYTKVAPSQPHPEFVKKQVRR